MSVYVDHEFRCGPVPGWRWPTACHLIADSVQELHDFARSIGLKREWFQTKSVPHYDLNSRRRAAALAAGAIEVDRDEFVRRMRALRALGEER